MSVTSEVILNNGQLRLQLLPAWGGRIGRLSVSLPKGKSREILRPIPGETEFDPLAWPKGGAYPLIPYSNRIENAQFSYAGQCYRLPSHPAATPHTLHGISHTLPWQVLEQDDESATMRLDYAGDHWPWPIRVEQRIALGDSKVSLRLSLTNMGETAMPGGLGIHPYFDADGLRQVRYRFRRAWMIGADYLPTGESNPSSVDAVLSPGNWLNTELAQYLSEWGGQVRMDYPEGTLDLSAGPSLSHLVIFAPKAAPYVCIEPVSHLANAINLRERVKHGAGMHIIQPGYTLTAELALVWTPSIPG